jgi:hypothetical protein
VFRDQLLHKWHESLHSLRGWKHRRFFGGKMISDLMRKMPFNLKLPRWQLGLADVRTLNPHAQRQRVLVLPRKRNETRIP